MKKIFTLVLAVIICLSISACNNTTNSDTNTTEQNTTESQTPTIEDIVNGIKYEFKDPDSVQLSDASIAPVKNGDEDSKTEFYVIGTIRAKNGFGGYGEPQAYIIHCDNGTYRIVKEYNDYPFMTQKTFNELGCGISWGLY